MTIAKDRARASALRRYMKRTARDSIITGAQAVVKKMIKSGELTRPETCSLCGKGGIKIHGHHDDYSKPQIVRWVCHPCHRRIHTKNPNDYVLLNVQAIDNLMAERGLTDRDMRSKSSKISWCPNWFYGIRNRSLKGKRVAIKSAKRLAYKIGCRLNQIIISEPKPKRRISCALFHKKMTEYSLVKHKVS